MRRPKLKVAVRLSTGHTTLRPHDEIRTHTAAGLATVSDEKKANSAHIACHCLAQACKRYRYLGCTFFKPKDLENMKVKSLICLLANTRLGTAL
jgi:hypothetical protein